MPFYLGWNLFCIYLQYILLLDFFFLVFLLIKSSLHYQTKVMYPFVIPMVRYDSSLARVIFASETAKPCLSYSSGDWHWLRLEMSFLFCMLQLFWYFFKSKTEKKKKKPEKTKQKPHNILKKIGIGNSLVNECISEWLMWIFELYFHLNYFL